MMSCPGFLAPIGKFVEVRDEEEKARRLEALDDLGFEWKGRGKKEKVDVVSM